jgi:hypothetical protein
LKLFAPIFFLLCLTVPILAESQETHCNDGEAVYFNCLVKGSSKVASVCGMGYSEEKNEPGYIQYRFGPIGQEEFVFPSGKSRLDLQDKFTFSSTRSAEYDRYDFDLQFDHLSYAYSVRQIEDRKQEPVKYSSSVTVWRLEQPCTENCPQRAPYAAPEKRLVKVFNCTNGRAGENLLQVRRIIPLITTLGKSSASKYR